MDASSNPAPEPMWPELPLEGWKDTYETLHRYAQIVGKVRLALAPMMNHWWQVALYVTSRGLTTSPMPFGAGETAQIDFDFVDHELSFQTSRGERKVMALGPRPVAEFYRDVMATLRELGVEVSIWEVPVEIPDDLTPFHEDRHHASYDPDAVHRWWRALTLADDVLKQFRARFTGKCSPVHFFWGSFDLAVTRFSGRPAPPRPGADLVTQEAYCEEVCSAGFWPGTERSKGAVFYAYAVPEPKGFSTAQARPAAAYYDPSFAEFLLPYEAVRQAPSPPAALLEFLESTYDAAASLGRWDRARVERPLIGGKFTGRRRVPLPPEQPPPPEVRGP